MDIKGLEHGKTTTPTRYVHVCWPMCRTSQDVTRESRTDTAGSRGETAIKRHKSQRSCGISLGGWRQRSTYKSLPVFGGNVWVKDRKRIASAKVIDIFSQLGIDRISHNADTNPVATNRSGNTIEQLKTSHPADLLQPCLWIVRGFFIHTREKVMNHLKTRFTEAAALIECGLDGNDDWEPESVTITDADGKQASIDNLDLNVVEIKIRLKKSDIPSFLSGRNLF